MSAESSNGQTSSSASGLASGSQVHHLQSDFQLKEYETQFFGFTPKSFSDGRKSKFVAFID